MLQYFSCHLPYRRRSWVLRPLILRSICKSVRLSTRLSIRPQAVCPRVRPSSRHGSVCPCVHPPVCTYMSPSIRPRVCSSICGSICSSTDPSDHQSTGPSVCQVSVCQSIRGVRPSTISLRIHPSNVNPFLYPSMGLSVCSSAQHRFVRSQVHPSIRVSIRPQVVPSMSPSVSPWVYPAVRGSGLLPLGLSTRGSSLTVCLLVHQFVDCHI